MSDVWFSACFVHLNLGVDESILQQIYRRAIQCHSVYQRFCARNCLIHEWRQEAVNFWVDAGALLPDKSDFEIRQIIDNILSETIYYPAIIIGAPRGFRPEGAFLLDKVV